MRYGSFIATIALAGALVASASAETLRVAGNFPKNHSSSMAMERFKEAVEKRTDGEVTVNLFPAMQLGGAGENVTQVRSGSIFATWVGAAYMSRIVPEIEAISLPFVFDGRETAFRVIDGEIGEILEDRLSAKGFATLGWMELGARHVTNSVRALDSIEDFKGLKIRMQPNETHIASFKAIGANPQPMDIKELYSALQQGVMDGQENPYPIILTNNFDEVQTHLSDTSHFFDFILVAANKDRLQGLSKPNREAVRAAMKDAVQWQREKAAQESKEALAELKKSMTFTPIPDKTRSKLRERTSDVVENVKERAGAELVEQVIQQATESGS